MAPALSQRHTPNWASVILYCEGDAPLLFTENETNNERIFGTPNASPLRQRRDQQLRGERKAGRRQPGT